MTTATPQIPGNYLDVNGARVVTCRLTIGASGTWVADVKTATDDPIVGAPTLAGAVGVTLRLGDLVLVGAVMRDQAFAGSRGLLLVGGAGGWAKTIPAQAYHNDAGIPRALPLVDVATAAGEIIHPVELAAATDLLGSDFVRESAPASRLLEQLAGTGWWVDAVGLTHILPRLPVPIASPFLVENYHRATGRMLVSTESLSEWMPGAIVASPQFPTPRILSSVTFDAKDDGTLRIEALTAPVAAMPASDRLLTALRALVRAELSALTYLGSYEYSVDKIYEKPIGSRTIVFDGSPITASNLPGVVGVPLRPALAGAKVLLKKGSAVLVGFVDGNPSRPVVLAHDPTPAKSVDLATADDDGPPSFALAVMSSKQPTSVSLIAENTEQGDANTTLVAQAASGDTSIGVTSKTALGDAALEARAESSGNATASLVANGAGVSSVSLTAEGGLATASVTAPDGVSLTAVRGAVTVVATGATLVLNAAMIAKLNALP